MKKKKVVITFCEAGQGHIVTAEAIAESLEKKYSDKLEIVRAHVFRDSNDKDLQNYEKFAIKEVKRSNQNRFHLATQLLTLKLLGAQNTLKISFSTAFGRVKNKLIDIYSKMNADAIVSTYFAPYHIACCAKAKKKISSLVVAYDPDHNVHGWWDKRGDLFVTNNQNATKEAIERWKFNKDIIQTVNFIARQNIVKSNESKAFYRTKYNLPQNKFTVILADGAYAAAKLEEFTNTLLTTDLPITIISICGKNEKLLKKYEQLKPDVKSNITFVPLGFQSDIQELYCASDLFITKAGPNAITDCVFMHTPIMTNFYSGEIEKTSSKLFTETYKVGTYCPDKEKAKQLVESYIKNPLLLDEYIKNTYQLDKTKNGADEIADIIAKKLGVI